MVPSERVSGTAMRSRGSGRAGWLRFHLVSVSSSNQERNRFLTHTHDLCSPFPTVQGGGERTRKPSQINRLDKDGHIPDLHVNIRSPFKSHSRKDLPFTAHAGPTRGGPADRPTPFQWQHLHSGVGRVTVSKKSGDLGEIAAAQALDVNMLGRAWLAGCSPGSGERLPLPIHPSPFGALQRAGLLPRRSSESRQRWCVRCLHRLPALGGSQRRKAASVR